MRNPDLDYQAGLTDLYLVSLDGGTIQVGECDKRLKEYLETRHSDLEFKPSRSVMRFGEKDVVGIGSQIA